jgi:nucleoside-diphosphate-sugar epimerase
MEVLIIGGTGLISTAITRELVDRGDHVTIYNRGQTQAPLPSGVRHLSGDRRNFAAFEAHMRDDRLFDCVIDMVCYHPDEAESLVRAFGGRIGQLIFCSTVDVYNKPAQRYPIQEDEPRSASPRFQYALDKVLCEQILERANQQGRLPLTIIRPAHTYGEGRGLIYSLGGGTAYLDRIAKGKPIVVHGDGTSLWASCHRDDVAHAFVTAAGNPTTLGQSYHVTGEEWMTWNRYHTAVAEAMDAPPPTLVHIPTDLLAQALPERAWICAENFMFNNIFDNSAARRDLDFSYSIPFVDGVRRIVTWLHANGGFDNSDLEPSDDRLIATWERFSEALVQDLRAEA